VFSDVVQSFTNGLPFEDFSSEIGFRYHGASYEPAADDPCGCAGLGTDGFVLNIPNSTAWFAEDPELPFGAEHALNNEVRLLFRGSGVGMWYAAHARGQALKWEVVDGGTEGAFNAVATGGFSTLNSQAVLRSATLVPEGTLDDERLYMLRVWPDEGDFGPLPPRWLSLDAFDVFGAKPFTIDDSLNVRGPSNLDGTWIPSVEWGDDLDASVIPAVGGGISRSNVDAATMSVRFNGSAVAIMGRQDAGVTATFDWKINDGGPGLEGTVDQTIDSDQSMRWPHVLVNGLPYDEHTLTITVRNNGGAGTAGALGPKPQADGGWAELDAISIVSFRDLGVAADFDLDQTVDGFDFLTWQRNFGQGPDILRAAGDANRDGLNNRADFLIWQREFGNSVAGSVAAVAAVPEPSSALVALVGAALAGLRRRRR
jgi:hypothetical protein